MERGGGSIPYVGELILLRSKSKTSAIDSIDARINSILSRIDSIRARINSILAIVDSILARTGSILSMVNSITRRIASIASSIDSIVHRGKSKRRSVELIASWTPSISRLARSKPPRCGPQPSRGRIPRSVPMSHRRVDTWKVAFLLFGSGACSLAYQTVWLRELRLVFGSLVRSDPR